MEFSGKWTAYVTGFQIKANASHDGQEAHVDLEIGIKQEEAENKLGKDFATMAFSTMRVMEAQGDEDTDAIAFLVDSVKPGHRVVFPLHAIDIDGQEITAQPELRGIKTVDGEARVIAQLRIPVDVSKKAMLNKIIGQVGGSPIKIDLSPVQGKLFTEEQAKGNGRMRVVKGQDQADVANA